MSLPSTICGHERDALIWACSPGFNSENCITTSMVKAVAFRATRDPAKLAELMAEVLREKGVSACVADSALTHVYSDARIVVWFSLGSIRLDYVEERDEILTLAQARAAMLRILSLPEGATADDATKALAEP